MAEVGHRIQGVDFPGSPPLKTPGFPMQGVVGWIPGWSTKSSGCQQGQVGVACGQILPPLPHRSSQWCSGLLQAGCGATGRGKEKCALGAISTRGVSRVIKHLHMAVVTQLLHNEDSCAVLALKGPAIS